MLALGWEPWTHHSSRVGISQHSQVNQTPWQLKHHPTANGCVVLGSWKQNLFDSVNQLNPQNSENEYIKPSALEQQYLTDCKKFDWAPLWMEDRPRARSQHLTIWHAITKNIRKDLESPQLCSSCSLVTVQTKNCLHVPSLLQLFPSCSPTIYCTEQRMKEELLHCWNIQELLPC